MIRHLLRWEVVRERRLVIVLKPLRGYYGRELAGVTCRRISLRIRLAGVD
mgnify:CR=1 FL=1